MKLIGAVWCVAIPASGSLCLEGRPLVVCSMYVLLDQNKAEFPIDEKKGTIITPAPSPTATPLGHRASNLLLVLVSTYTN